jgi:hypothetical protein
MDDVSREMFEALTHTAEHMIEAHQHTFSPRRV